MESNNDDMNCYYCNTDDGEDYYTCEKCYVYLCDEHVIINPEGVFFCKDCVDIKKN